MKITDYTKIAEQYDKNKVRHDIPKDEIIETRYKADPVDFTVLDLSCGTGNYLKKQKAKEKILYADLIVGDVMEISLPNNTERYIKNRFA